MSLAGEIAPHSGECGPTPKEQPPPETLRQKDRSDARLWKAAAPSLVLPTEGVNPRSVPKLGADRCVREISQVQGQRGVVPPIAGSEIRVPRSVGGSAWK